jgi:hypothetical protein
MTVTLANTSGFSNQRRQPDTHIRKDGVWCLLGQIEFSQQKMRLDGSAKERGIMAMCHFPKWSSEYVVSLVRCVAD